MDDRQPVGIDRPVRLLWDKVIHNPQKSGGEEESDGVMAVPPLRQGILHAGPGDIAFRAEERDRDRRVVDQVQHRDRDDKREIEPVGDINMRFLAAREGRHENQKIGHPDECEPDIHVPFRLGIFLGLRDPEEISGCGEDEEQLVAPEHEPRRDIAGETGPAGTLYNVERRRNKYIAAKSENNRRCMKRAQPAEIGPGQIEVQDREGKLQCKPETHGKSDNAPESRRDNAGTHDPFIIDRNAIAIGRAYIPVATERFAESQNRPRNAESEKDETVYVKCLILRTHFNLLGINPTGGKKNRPQPRA